MNIYDIIGPVMVGPSSSHTAGAARIGYIARKLLGETVKDATILLYGSFLATGQGHGTQKALVAGLLEMQPDDIRIPDSLDIAKSRRMNVYFGEANLRDAHPNSVELILTGVTGRSLEVVGESLGGSIINIAKIDGIQTNFSGDYPTLVVHNLDQPGHVTEVTSMLAHKSINIATMQLYRSNRGGDAAVFLSYEKCFKVPEDRMIEAMFITAGIGVVFAVNASIAGASGGCQAEIGTASAMAAAGLAYLQGGDNVQIVNAMSLAMKNMLGSTCDPVCGLVEVPCIKRNSAGAVNSVASAQIAMAGIVSAISPDEVIDSMRRIGEGMPACVKETGTGGLAATPTALKIWNRLEDKNKNMDI